MRLPARVVAAVRGELQPRIRAILPASELRFARCGSELVRALDEAPCDLLVVEAHFDESAAAAALGCVLAREETFPVVCVRDVPSGKPPHAALNALRMTLGAVAPDVFIDLSDYPDEEAGNARVRLVLERVLAVSSPTPV